MFQLMKKGVAALKSKIVVGVTALFASVASFAQSTIDLSGPATTFQTDFGAAAAAIGGALIAAGFVALVYKWAKGMLFS